jgi:HJR/Mrr/RecB family endonuclease
VIDDQIAKLCLSHFLCTFDPKSKKRKTRDVIKDVTLPYYSAERVNEFLDNNLQRFQATLVDEFNARYASQMPLRFQIADTAGVGVMVEGYRPQKRAKELRFQDALQKTSPKEFEKLAAIILKVLGCTEVFFTPYSHDQGVDAFGYQEIVAPMPYGTSHRLTWIAQAKHYLASGVSTGDVRELIGSKELLIAKAYSTVDERYKELSLKHFAPTAVALVTTEEIPATVRRLAQNAGVFVFAASDLFHILSPLINTNTVAGLRALLRQEEKGISTLS